MYGNSILSICLRAFEIFRLLYICILLVLFYTSAGVRRSVLSDVLLLMGKPNHHDAFIYLYRIPLCSLINEHVKSMAVKFPAVKFVSFIYINASGAHFSFFSTSISDCYTFARNRVYSTFEL